MTASAEPRPNLRAILRLAGLILLFLACIGPHLLSKLLFGRSGWPRRFLRAAAWIIGARVQVRGEPVRAHTLLIVNHLSWMDILVVAGATGAAFVSKDNLGHGLVHWLADQNATLYVRRDHVKGAKRQAEMVAEALDRGTQPVAVFPEGTTGPGDSLLPFRSTLLESAVAARRSIAVRPVALDYGAAATEIAWYHESGRNNVLRLLGRKGVLSVTVHLLPPLNAEADRKAMTAAAREAIGDALASNSAGTRL